MKNTPRPQHAVNRMRTLARERDAARARNRQLEAVNESLVRTINDIPCSGEAGCEARAGVAWLIKWLKTFEHDPERLRGEREALNPSAGEKGIRAKLQRAEAVAKAVKTRRDYFEREYGWVCRGPQPWSAGVTEQDRMEFEALTAWEEGTA